MAVAAVLGGCLNAPFATWPPATPGAPPARPSPVITATPHITIQPAAPGERPALVLVAHKQQRQPRTSGDETRRLLLDPDTFLPRALEVQYGPGTVGARSTFQHAFIPVDAVPADFFDPASLRFVRPDPQAALDRVPPGFPLYWLGAQFAPSAGVPPLELWAAEWRTWTLEEPDDPPAGRSPAGSQSFNALELYYMRADDPVGEQPLVHLTAYRRADWDALRAQPRGRDAEEGPCWVREELRLPQGRATLFLGFQWRLTERRPDTPDPCPTDRAHDLFRAHVYLGEAVIIVDYGGEARRNQTREGLEALVRALRPHTSPR